MLQALLRCFVSLWSYYLLREDIKQTPVYSCGSVLKVLNLPKGFPAKFLKLVGSPVCFVLFCFSFLLSVVSLATAARGQYSTVD